MNDALKQEWIENRGISVGKIALNPITLTEEDMKKINELEDAANIGSNPFMMAGRMTDATADAMQTAAGNSAGAMTGFMGMGMVGMGGQGGFGAAQNLYNMGAQQQMAKQPQNPPLDNNGAERWKCSCGAVVAVISVPSAALRNRSLQRTAHGNANAAPLPPAISALNVAHRSLRISRAGPAPAVLSIKVNSVRTAEQKSRQAYRCTAVINAGGSRRIRRIPRSSVPNAETVLTITI